MSPELFPDAAVDDEVGRGVDRQEEVVKVQQVKHQDLKREQFSSLGFFFLLPWNSLAAQFSIGHTPGIEPRPSASRGKPLTPTARLQPRVEQFLTKWHIAEAWFAYAILLLTGVN